MREKVLEKIEALVDIIYTPDQNGVDHGFIELIDTIGLYIHEVEQSGKSVELDKELQSLQMAYIKKDYVLFADVLLYELKTAIEAIG